MSLEWVWMVAVMATGSAEDAAVALARDTVRARVSAPESSVHLLDVAQVQWNDTSLGCPEKGTTYAQVLTEGYRVRLRVEDRTFDVRVAGERAVLCDRVARVGRLDKVATMRMVREARSDLARRLQIPETGVEVQFVRPTIWPAQQRGCDGAMAEPDPAVERTSGYVVSLGARGKIYEYRADAAGVVSCDE